MRLVDNHELVRDRPAADVGERLHDHASRGHELVEALLGGAALGALVDMAAAGREQVGDVVEDGLHPHRQLLVLVAGKEPESLTGLDRGACEDEAPDLLLAQGSDGERGGATTRQRRWRRRPEPGRGLWCCVPW